MLQPYALSTANYICLSTASEIAKLAQKAEEYKNQTLSALLDAAPEDLRKLLQNEAVIEHLLDYGRAEMKIYFDREHFGMPDLVTAKKKIASLTKAWKKNVKILIAVGEPHRVTVTFFAATPD